MDTNHEDKYSNGTKYLLRRRVSATSDSKLGSGCDKGWGADFVPRGKKLKSCRVEDNEEELVVGRGKECNAHRTGVSSEGKSGIGEMSGGTEGREDVDQFQVASETHNHGKAFGDCSPADPATVPRKLRSAMNKRNRKSISPPLPESKELNASHASRITTMAHTNGTQKSKQGMKKKANAAARSMKKAASMAVTKAEQEVAEALYVLSRISPTRSVRSKIDGEIEEAKPSISSEDKASKLPCHFPTEAASKKPSENAKEVKTDVSSNCVEVNARVVTDAIAFNEKLGPASDGQMDVQINSPFNKQSSTLPLTALQNNLDVSCSQPISEKGMTRPFILNLLPPYVAEKGPLQPETLVPEREEPFDRNACVGTAGVGSVINTTNCSYSSLDIVGSAAHKLALQQHSTISETKSLHHLDFSGPPSTQVASRQDTAVDGTVPAPMNKDPSQGKKSWKRCAAHVYLSHFIHGNTSVVKVPCWAVHFNHPPPESDAVANAVSGASKHKDNHPFNLSTSSDYQDNGSCSLTTALQRNPQARLQPDPILVSDQSYSRKPQSIDFLKLSSGGGDPATLRKLNNVVESSLPLNSSYIQGVQHQSVLPFSIQAARLPTGYVDQPQVATASDQQVRLAQYLSNPFLNPRATAATLTTSATSAPKNQQQLWAPGMMHYNQPAQLPKFLNGRTDGISLLRPCSQASSSLTPHLSMAYAPHDTLLFPVASGNKKLQVKREEQISEDPL